MFFAERKPGSPGLALFFNAGDPPLPIFHDVLRMLDESSVDCLELAVPFPDSPTDGPVVRRSAQRALAAGATLDDTLKFVARVRPSLRHLRIALLVDWSHSVRPGPLADILRGALESGCDGLLLHGLPPRLQASYYDEASQVGMPIVTTCYATSAPEVVSTAARHASAYVYLVSRYGRSGADPRGGSTVGDEPGLSDTLSALRAQTKAPIAVGFGVRTGEDVAALHAIGADAVVVGSAAVARVESGLATAQFELVSDLHRFVSELRHPQPQGVQSDCPRSLAGQNRRMGQWLEPQVPVGG